MRAKAIQAFEGGAPSIPGWNGRCHPLGTPLPRIGRAKIVVTTLSPHGDSNEPFETSHLAILTAVSGLSLEHQHKPHVQLDYCIYLHDE